MFYELGLHKEPKNTTFVGFWYIKSSIIPMSKAERFNIMVIPLSQIRQFGFQKGFARTVLIDKFNNDNTHIVGQKRTSF